jgi:hypothetical protein
MFDGLLTLSYGLGFESDQCIDQGVGSSRRNRAEDLLVSDTVHGARCAVEAKRLGHTHCLAVARVEALGHRHETFKSR